MVPRSEMVELSLLSRKLLVAEFFSPLEVGQCAVVAQPAVRAESTAAIDYLTMWDHKRLVYKSICSDYTDKAAL